MKTVSSDKSMRDAVARELDWDAKLNADHVGITAKGGAIVLSGHVSTYLERWSAVKAAERVYGVRAVADEIEVQLPSSNIRDDSDIAEEVSRLVKWNTAIPTSVQAEVADGHVTLRGEVEWSYQRAEAERSIRYLAGVHDMANLITIKPRAPKAEDVAERVGDAIERMAGLDARSVWVTTSNGSVRLHGHVHSLAERRSAGLAAASAPGVAGVENEILVTP